jgi:hypothetical protein
MAEHDFTVGQADNNVPWDQAIVDANGNPIDLTGATSVVLHTRVADASAPAVDRVGSVTGVAPNTKARYLFLAADTATPDVFDAEWFITLANGELITFPACAGRAKQTFEVFPKR